MYSNTISIARVIPHSGMGRGIPDIELKTLKRKKQGILKSYIILKTLAFLCNHSLPQEFEGHKVFDKGKCIPHNGKLEGILF